MRAIRDADRPFHADFSRSAHIAISLVASPGASPTWLSLSCPGSVHDLIRACWPEYHHYRGKLLLAFVAMLVVAGATAAIAWMMKFLLVEVLIQKHATLLHLLPLPVIAAYLAKGPGSYAQDLCHEPCWSGYRVQDVRPHGHRHAARADAPALPGRVHVQTVQQKPGMRMGQIPRIGCLQGGHTDNAAIA